MLYEHDDQTSEVPRDGECSALEFRVCSSFAGFYIGTYCDGRGPLSRESEYYKRRRDAECDLRNHTVRWRS